MVILKVGRTYLTREGHEVKIVDYAKWRDNDGKPWEGSNGLWYTDFGYYHEEVGNTDSRDLVKLVPWHESLEARVEALEKAVQPIIEFNKFLETLDLNDLFNGELLK
jgi:hypothetical protein